ncbi:MAG TPA: catalase-peroxidase, partial [Gammaproteobacteria bacterium]|nr:catalase-peroxidase [Gammaproteobacteria bacterium]
MLKKTLSVLTALTIGLSPLASISPVFAQDGVASNDYWWPNRLSLEPLRNNSPASDPMGEEFDYAAEFLSLDLDKLVADLEEVMTTSQDWWPADY